MSKNPFTLFIAKESTVPIIISCLFKTIAIICFVYIYIISSSISIFMQWVSFSYTSHSSLDESVIKLATISGIAIIHNKRNHSFIITVQNTECVNSSFTARISGPSITRPRVYPSNTNDFIYSFTYKPYIGKHHVHIAWLFCNFDESNYRRSCMRTQEQPIHKPYFFIIHKGAIGPGFGWKQINSSAQPFSNFNLPYHIFKNTCAYIKYEVLPYDIEECVKQKKHILFVGTSHGANIGEQLKLILNNTNSHIQVHYPYGDFWRFHPNDKPFWGSSFDHIPSDEYAAIIVSFGQHQACYNSSLHTSYTPWSFKMYRERVEQYISYMAKTIPRHIIIYFRTFSGGPLGIFKGRSKFICPMQDWRTIPVQEHFNDILKSLLGKQSRVKLLDTTPATDPVWDISWDGNHLHCGDVSAAKLILRRLCLDL